MSDELHYITATEAIAAFKARTLSPVELMDAVIARIEAINDSLNAFTYTFFDRARDQARAAEAAYAKGAETGPLEGIPIVIKDLHAVAGEITTMGSKAFADHRPEKSAPTVERLLAAGAIMHARSTTPEFAHGPYCKSDLWGVSRNPWNTDMSPGGSTGGGAAAVATGMTVLADGTDAAGSIRNPCAQCGIFGFDPPFGRNPLDSSLPRESFLHYGPMTRTVADAALMQNVTAGPHLDDACSLRPKLEIPDELAPVKGWKVAVSMDLGYFNVDEGVQKAVREATQAFAELGCTLTDVDVGWDFGVLDAQTTFQETLLAALAGDLYPRWKYEMDAMVRVGIERGLQLSAKRFYDINFVRGRMYQTLGPILEEHDILLCPVTALPGLPAVHDLLDTSLRINGKPLTYGNLPGDKWLHWQLSYPFNMVPECPVAAVPAGFVDGLPVGMQIVGRTYDDVAVFRAAADYERARPWRHKRPPI